MDVGIFSPHPNGDPEMRVTKAELVDAIMEVSYVEGELAKLALSPTYSLNVTDLRNTLRNVGKLLDRINQD